MRALSISCLAVATALFFVATPAQARFGRSDQQGQGNGNHGNHNGNGNGNGNGGGGNHGTSSGNGGGGGRGTHPATPITNDDGHSNGRGWGHVQHGNGNGYGHDHEATPVTTHDGDGDDQTEVVVRHEYDPYYYGPEPGYCVGYQPIVGYDPSYDNADRVRVFLIGEATGASGSMTLAGSLRMDGRQWGFVADGRALFFSAYPTVDVIDVAHAHVTYALISIPNGRVRAELGVAGAFAEQLTAFGPSLGVSADLALISGFGVEASAHAVPYPYLSAEYSAGASLSLGAGSIHAGWRSIHLDDAGLVDGVPHSDSSSGPYVAVGLTF